MKFLTKPTDHSNLNQSQQFCKRLATLIKTNNHFNVFNAFSLFKAKSYQINIPISQNESIFTIVTKCRQKATIPTDLPITNMVMVLKLSLSSNMSHGVMNALPSSVASVTN